ncbi:hypothetical protein N7478_012933 [Penicillium angulare]|uniref:uncharacterized protein n=1 Tax=Penicillium angulare TaxID=116970 RepID=UPI00253F92A8|nr:uncharacterized protein N7478_012933 [Penicillium angulare]KAJ5256829.1 hypothetical protein N7478_012933 [Penicillium angulare]
MAFDLSVKLSLHQSVNDQSIFSEARKRAWWMTVWKQYVLAEETLVSATLFLTSLVGGFQTKTAIPKLQHGAQKLQEIIDVQLKTCESIQLGVADTEKSPESRVVSCLTTISRMRLKR